MTAQQTARYPAPSAVLGRRLALATRGRDATAFFDGYAENPAVVAAALLLIARVARTRFFETPGMIAARSADPVVTTAETGLRFESFSACGGVYARLDVLHDGLDVRRSVPGVTNVDVNHELRSALSTLPSGDPLRITVGAEALVVSTLDGVIVEERVPLPDRWLRGFAETQVSARSTELAIELDAGRAAEFVATLPATSLARASAWAAITTSGALRLGSRPTAGSVGVSGPDRLNVLAPMMRFVSGMRGYAARSAAEGGAQAGWWVLDLPAARVTIGLSPEKARGFSGEGGVLRSLVDDRAAEDAQVVGGVLALDPRVDLQAMAARVGIPVHRVEPAITALAMSGQVGWDHTESAWFHRPLPFQADATVSFNPRLRGARAIVDGGSVVIDTDGTFRVRSGSVLYTGSIASDPARCTCPWFGKHRGSRGDCKHVLAARIAAHGGSAS